MISHLFFRVWPFHTLSESELAVTEVNSFLNPTLLSYHCLQPCDFSKTPISAIFVYHDPRNWALDGELSSITNSLTEPWHFFSASSVWCDFGWRNNGWPSWPWTQAESWISVLQSWPRLEIRVSSLAVRTGRFQDSFPGRLQGLFFNWVSSTDYSFQIRLSQGRNTLVFNTENPPRLLMILQEDF